MPPQSPSAPLQDSSEAEPVGAETATAGAAPEDVPVARALVAIEAPGATPARLLTTPRMGLLLALSIVAGIAVGYFVGSHTGVRPAVEAGARVEAASLAQALPWKSEIASDAGDKHEIAHLLDELRSLRAQIEQVRHTVEAARAGERAAETASRLDKFEERIGRVERLGADRTATGAIAPVDRAAAAKPEQKRPETKPADSAAKAPQPGFLRGRYVLRDVIGGVALIERRDGLIEEVAPGDDLPGAGRVTAIERRGREWVVVTTRGIIDGRSF